MIVTASVTSVRTAAAGELNTFPSSPRLRPSAAPGRPALPAAILVAHEHWLDNALTERLPGENHLRGSGKPLVPLLPDG